MCRHFQPFPELRPGKLDAYDVSWSIKKKKKKKPKKLAAHHKTCKEGSRKNSPISRGSKG